MNHVDSSSSPLLLTADPELSAATTRLAAAAGTPLDLPVWTGPDRAGDALPPPGWSRAPLVLVGSDHVGPLAGSALPRRDGVHVVTLGSAPDRLFRDAVALGAESVTELPSGERGLVELLTDLGDRGRRPGRTVGVVGGSGGVGATVLTAALALAAGRRGSAVALDLDPLGPGLRRVVGLDTPAEVTWADLARTPGRLGSASLREALPAVDGVAVLGWPDDPQALPGSTLVGEVMSAAARGHDWVLVDVPRSGDPSIVGTALAGCDDLLLVVHAGLGSVAASARVAARLRGSGARLGAVVRSRRGGPLPEEVAGALDLPLAGVVGVEPRLDEHLDLGLGPAHRRRSRLGRAAESLMSRLEAQR